MSWSSTQVREIVSQRGKRSAELLARDYGTTKGAIVGIWTRARVRDPSIPKLNHGLSEFTKRKLEKRNSRIRKARKSGVPRREIVTRFGLSAEHVMDIYRGVSA